ncbi:unnamed protein product [[Candida] boidinii]|nr:unnamed protein product [[Candida] boidinii]
MSNNNTNNNWKFPSSSYENDNPFYTDECDLNDIPAFKDVTDVPLPTDTTGFDPTLSGTTTELDSLFLSDALDLQDLSISMGFHSEQNSQLLQQQQSHQQHLLQQQQQILQQTKLISQDNSPESIGTPQSAVTINPSQFVKRHTKKLSGSGIFGFVGVGEETQLQIPGINSVPFNRRKPLYEEVSRFDNVDFKNKPANLYNIAPQILNLQAGQLQQTQEISQHQQHNFQQQAQAQQISQQQQLQLQQQIQQQLFQQQLQQQQHQQIQQQQLQQQLMQQQLEQKQAAVAAAAAAANASAAVYSVAQDPINMVSEQQNMINQYMNPAVNGKPSKTNDIIVTENINGIRIKI